jgi:hypothetical protein
LSAVYFYQEEQALAEKVQNIKFSTPLTIHAMFHTKLFLLPFSSLVTLKKSESPEGMSLKQGYFR